MTTSLTTVPSLAIFPENGMDAIKINFYSGSVDIQQGESTINIEDDVLEEFIKALRKGRKEDDYYLSKK